MVGVKHGTKGNLREALMNRGKFHPFISKALYLHDVIVGQLRVTVVFSTRLTAFRNLVLHVIGIRSDKNVVRVYAQSIIAAVAGNKTFWYGTLIKKLPRKAMGGLLHVAANLKISVLSVVHSFPSPASVLLFFDELHESFQDQIFHWRSLTLLLLLMPACPHVANATDYGYSNFKSSTAFTGPSVYRSSAPTALSATANNYAWPQFSTIRQSATRDVSITGFAYCYDGLTFTLFNASTNTITIVDQSTMSSVGDRIVTGSGSDVAIAPGGSRTFWCDSSSPTWRVRN